MTEKQSLESWAAHLQGLTKFQYQMARAAIIKNNLVEARAWQQLAAMAWRDYWAHMQDLT